MALQYIIQILHDRSPLNMLNMLNTMGHPKHQHAIFLIMSMSLLIFIFIIYHFLEVGIQNIWQFSTNKNDLLCVKMDISQTFERIEWKFTKII